MNGIEHLCILLSCEGATKQSSICFSLFFVATMGTVPLTLSSCLYVFPFSVTLIVTLGFRVFYPPMFGGLKFLCNVFWVLCLEFQVLCPCTVWYIIVPLCAYKLQYIHLPHMSGDKSCTNRGYPLKVPNQFSEPEGFGLEIFSS